MSCQLRVRVALARVENAGVRSPPVSLHQRVAFGSLLLLGVACSDSDRGNPFIDWAQLQNPILAVEDRMLKDASFVYDDRSGWFYVFPSARLA